MTASTSDLPDDGEPAASPLPQLAALRRKADILDRLKAAGLRVYEDPYFQVMLVHGTLDAVVSVIDQAITEAKT